MQEELRMNAQELSKVSVIQSVITRNITQVGAAKILELSERQIRRLKKTYQRDGAPGLLSKKRGKPSNRLYP